jgi:RimJ/RimL family protein N-acetyltransferase
MGQHHPHFHLNVFPRYEWMPIDADWNALHRRDDAPLGGPLEIGYFLRANARGRGLATRSLRLASEWLLAGGHRRIDLCTHPDNLPSQAVARRAGYEPSGDVEEYATFKDGTTRAPLFSLTR